MILEYCNYDISSNEQEIKENIEISIKYFPKSIIVIPYYLKYTKKYLPDTIQLGCTIDYPFGISSQSSRINEFNEVKSCDPDIINVVAPIHILTNRKYDKFRAEVDTFLDILSDSEIKLRYILEYKICSLNLLYKIVDILLKKNINVVYPSAGYLLDNISDNLLASFLINKKYPNMHIIANGGAWNDKQIDTVLNSQNYGFQTNNIYTLEKIYQKTHY